MASYPKRTLHSTLPLLALLVLHSIASDVIPPKISPMVCRLGIVGMGLYRHPPLPTVDFGAQVRVRQGISRGCPTLPRGVRLSGVIKVAGNGQLP